MSKHLRNLATYRIVEILTILLSAHTVASNQDMNVLYVNNYIDRDQFNCLYTLN